MRWTRRPTTRAAALAASVYLVIAYADELSTWFWVGLVLVVLNVVGLVAHARSKRPAQPAPAEVDPDATSARLSELLHDPAVASAWATAPPYWVRVTHPDEPAGQEPHAAGDVVAATVVAEHVRITLVGLEWQVVVEEEAGPFLDLDATGADDAVLEVLRAHPLVAEARHEDREVYVVRAHRELALDRFARLAAGALATGQVRAASRLR